MFFLKMAHSSVGLLHIFERRWGLPHVTGPKVTYPPPLSFNGLAHNAADATDTTNGTQE